MKREKVKQEMKETIEHLRQFAEELQSLYEEMDRLTDEEFDKKSMKIEDRYAEMGIELFG